MPRTATSPADVELAGELGTAVLRLSRRLRTQRSDSTLTPSQLAILGTLDRVGPVTPGGLATHERVQPPTMTRAVAGLEDLGLVAKDPSPDDRRQVVVSLTDAGRAILVDNRRLRAGWLADQLADLDDADVQLLARATRLLEALSQA